MMKIENYNASANKPGTKKRTLREAEGRVIGGSTIHIYDDVEMAEEFVYRLKLLLSWLVAKFLTPDEEA